MGMDGAALVGGKEKKIRINLRFEFRNQVSNERLKEKFDNQAITW